VKSYLPPSRKESGQHSSSTRKDKEGSPGKSTFKLGQGMPLSAKHATQSPIKIIVSVGEASRGGVRKQPGLKEANVSGERDASGFLIKKATARSDVKVNSIERELKNRSNSKIELFSDRRDSLKPDSQGLRPKNKPTYISHDLLSLGSKKLAEDPKASKSKIKLGTSIFSSHGSTPTEAVSRLAKPKLASNSSAVLRPPHKPAATSHAAATSQQKGLQLASAVTQVPLAHQLSEEDMNKLGSLYAGPEASPQQPQDKGGLSSPDLDEAVRRGTKKDYSQGRLQYYVGAVLLFFKDPKNDYFGTLYKEHFRHTFFSLKYCKTLPTLVSADLASKQRFYPPARSSHPKRCLVLDLDETLVHCVTVAGQKAEVFVPVQFPSGENIQVPSAHQAPLNIRPHALPFLQRMSELFEVFIFTASNSCYADAVLDYLDPDKKLISHRLYRESCTQTPAGMYVKDLRVIGGRDLEEMVLVDNASYSFGFQLDCGIPIIPFYDSRQDKELQILATYLEALAKAPNVRAVNRAVFRLRDIAACNSIDDAFRLYTHPN